MPQISYREASRIRVLEAPRMNPGTCVVCGAARTDDRQYVDFGLDIDFYGVVYFCTFCIQEVVNHLGMLTKEQSEALEEENMRLRERVLNFDMKEKALDEVIRHLRTISLFELNPADDLGDVTSPFVSDAPRQPETSDGDEPSIEDLINQAESASSKQRSSSVSSSRNRKSGGDLRI